MTPCEPERNSLARSGTVRLAPPPVAPAGLPPGDVARRLSVLRRGNWFMLAVALVAIFMVQFDAFVVNVSLPLLQHQLGAGPAALEMVVGGYAFVYAAGLVTGGRLGDLFGYRRLFLIGMAAFGGASLLCGISSSPAELVVARLLQGATAAAMVPQVLALIAQEFPTRERPRALAWFGVVMGVGAVAGQVFGGFLLSANPLDLGWRAIFFVNVPIAVLAVGFGSRALPAGQGATRPKLDPFGIVAVSGSLALALVPLTIGRTEGWPLWTWLCMAASAPAMAATLLWERWLARRGGEPLVDLRLFQNAAFNRGLVVSVAMLGAYFSFLFTLTLVLQEGLRLTPLHAALIYTPLGVSFTISSIVARRSIDRFGSQAVVVGIVVATVGVALLPVVVHVEGALLHAPDLIGPMVLVGLGNGVAIPALIGVVLSEIPTERAGIASGVLTTAQQFAGAAGVAGFGTLFFAVLGTREGPEGYGEAFFWTLLCALVLFLVALAVSTRLPRMGSAAMREEGMVPPR